MADADGLILHHYDNSPFSEKVRLMFGLKGLAWRSVIQPTIMPKPDLTALTGGYRRIPVMQAGADIFCDTQVILAEIERRAPSPAAATPMAYAVNLWADRLFFATTVPIIFGELGDNVPAEFIADREKLSGQAFNPAAMKAAAGVMRGQWRGQAAWIEDSLAAAGAGFLFGARPSLADISAYMNFWFLSGFTPAIAAELLARFDRIEGWRVRVAAIGHGQRSEMSPAEALQIAAAAEPGMFIRHDAEEPLGLEIGAPITVSADDYGRDPIAGTLIAANRDRVVLERLDDALGRLHVHFPRVGYIVTKAA